MKKPCLIALPLCLFLFPATILACSCLRQGPAYSFNDAKVVFIGRVLGGTQKFSVKGGTGIMSEIEAGQVRFSVEEIFKGSNAEELTIQVDSHAGTSCGLYGLKRGERYVVYAYASKLDDKEGGFHLEGFTSETYWIQARGLKPNDNVAKNSRSLKLAVSQNMKNLKLTLSELGGFGGCR